ncbi:MAG: MBL fold metallo-hydrolase [Deltaproteobacteria bacterium]|nr:MBL fold metallo-hydrolase [Deltaproteobacteria bacterium]
MSSNLDPEAADGGFTFVTLGMGDAFSALHYSASLLCERSGFRLLVDCPHPIRKILREATAGSVDIADIGAIALTHLHPDHASGIELFGYYLLYVLQRRIPLLMHAAVLEQARQPPLLLDRYFDLFSADDDRALAAGPFEVRFRRTRHMVPTGALRIAAGGRTLGNSSDTPFDPALISWLETADVVLHECGSSQVHTPPSQLQTLPAPLRERLWLFHVEDGLDLAGSGLRALVQGQRYRV